MHDRILIVRICMTSLLGLLGKDVFYGYGVMYRMYACMRPFNPEIVSALKSPQSLLDFV